MAQAVAGGLLEADLQALQQPGEAELLQGTTQGIVHEWISFYWKRRGRTGRSRTADGSWDARS